MLAIVLLAGGCGGASAGTPSPTPSAAVWHKVFSVTDHFIVLEDVPSPVYRLAEGRVRITATMFGGTPSGSGQVFAVALARAGGRRPWRYFPMPTNPATPDRWTVDLELPHAVLAGRYVLMVSGNGLTYDAVVFQRVGQ